MAEIIDLTGEPDRTVERKERRLLEIANSRAKDSIYWKVFMTILCLLNTDLCNEEELAFINKFKDEYNAATQYLYVRLFLRRRNKYHSIESINYDGFTSELTLSCLRRLSDDGLLISEVGSSLHDVLILLNSDALRELCKSLRIPTSSNNTKERMIAELKEQAKREAKAQKMFGIRKADGTAKVCKVQERARKLLGHVFKLNEKYFEIIQRFHLSYFCFTEWKEESFLVDELLTQFQKKSFPEYEFDNYFVFQNRQELLDYEYALKAEYSLVKFHEEKNYDDANEVVKKFLQEAKDCLSKDETIFSEELTEFVKVLRGWFSAKSVWMRFLRLSCEVYAKLKLREEEFMLLKILLYTPRFVGSTLSRGRLWDRLALVCERYAPLKLLQEFYPDDKSTETKQDPETKQEQDNVIILVDDDDDFVDDFAAEDSKSKGRKEKAKTPFATDEDKVLRRSITLKVLEEALNDESVSASRRICLEQRKARIEHSLLDAKERKRKRQESESPIDSVKDSYSDEENDTVPSVIFGQKVVPGTASGSRKSMWFLETGDNSTGGDVLHVTVEERVLLEYSQKSWTGYHAEGSLFSTLFSLLFYDILFMSDVPGAFIHGFQVAPMDLSTEWFYLNRKNEIDERLEELNDIKTAVQLLQETFDSILEKQPSCVGLSWDYPIDHLKDLCLCLGSERLKKVLQKFATNYRNSRSGLPDLTVWKPGTDLVKMIEVKGPGDRLRSHQELWKNALNDFGIPTEVCVTVVFGVVGIPVIEVAEACRMEGIQFIGMRNEQGAAYAANAWGYFTGQPGVCLVVSGPGLVHALSGLANAQENCFPMLLLAGSSDLDQGSKGAFQEMDQIQAAKQFTKYAARPDSIERIPFFVEKAMRVAASGRPGAAYIDLPGSLITGLASFEDDIVSVSKYQVAPRSFADPVLIRQAVKELLNAKKPLVIIGKGAALSRGSEVPIREFLEVTNYPFVPTPSGKGVISDLHPQSAAAARSTALKEADVIVLFGARLNWILHFGEKPRFRPDVKFIQIDISPEEIGNNSSGRNLGLVGDCGAVTSQLVSALREAKEPIALPSHSQWLAELNKKIKANERKTQELMNTTQYPMSYYNAFKIIKEWMPEDSIFVSEGANTMDIARTIFPQRKPRTRIDAGSFGTMGVGVGYAVAAQLAHPDNRVVSIQGDSAFGFSAMDIETCCRFKLPITFIIINNNGIYSGIEKISWEEAEKKDLPSTALLPNANYEFISKAFGGEGYLVKNQGELKEALQKADRSKMPVVINCLISPMSQRKAQEFNWLTRSEDSKL